MRWRRSRCWIRSDGEAGGLGEGGGKRGREAVTAVGQGFEVAGLVGGVGEGLAKLIDGVVQAPVEIDVGGTGPKLALEDCSADDFAGLEEQGGEKFKGLPGEADAMAVLAEVPCDGIEFEGSEG